MDFIFDCFAEIFFNLIFESFITLCSAFIPNKKMSEKSRQIIGIVFVFLALALCVGLVVGIILLVETKGKSIYGIILTTLALIYILVGTSLKIAAVVRKASKK